MSWPASPTPTLLPGAELDRYVLVRLIGVGGMAEVWEVRHRVLDSRHALKVLHAQGPRLAERLLAEGRAQAALEHENLLPVRDTVELGGAIGLIMPLVEGPGLDALLRTRRLSAEEALAMFLGIARAVAAVHARGWVHRDLKPGNVLLDLRPDRVVPRVADFGLVKLGGQEQAMGFWGTPGYAAPEQLEDAARVDASADLWSMGVMLVELLTGARPFPGETLAELREAHRRGPELGGLDGAVAELALDLLTPEPQARAQAAGDLVARIDGLVPDALSPLRRQAPLAQACAGLHPLELARQGERTAEPDTLSIAHAPSPVARLPPRSDQFLGRQAEQAELDALFREGATLVTLVGIGGSGKTRLALEHVDAARARWPGGLWFCDLTEARDEVGVLAAVAQALEIQLGREDPAEQLGRALAARGRVLLLLDNAEQVARVVAGLVDRWRAMAPRLKLLVTSRELLGSRGERTLELGPLDLPDRASRRPADVLAVAAGALLVARAREHDPRWTLREAEVSAAIELLELLDGLPLAIELAAARLRLMSLSALRDRMRDRFKLLAAPGRGGDRQGTMRAVLDWSWNLLSEAEQVALRQMSIFEGGFDIEAAEAVLELPEDGPWALDILQLLLDRSLVRQTSPRDGEPRFSLYVTVRDYVAERLSASEREALARRHGAHYSRLGTPEALDALTREGGRARLDALLLELGNLGSACHDALRRGDALVSVRTHLAMGELIGRVGAARVGGEALARAVCALATQGAEVDPTLAARAHGRAAQTLFWLGRSAEALEHFDVALGYAAGVADPALLARLGSARASVLFDLNRLAEARAQIEACLASPLQDRVARGRALRLLGILLENDGVLGQGIAHTRASLQIFEELGDLGSQAYGQNLLGIQLTRTGRLVEARRACVEAVRLSREAGSRDTEVRALMQLANIDAELGAHAEARENMEQALALCRGQGNQRMEAIVLTDLAEIAVAQGRAEEAIALNEEAMRRFEAMGRRRTLAIVLANLGFIYLDQGRAELAERAFASALSIAEEFKILRLKFVVLRGLGQVQARRGESAQARRTLTESADGLGQVGDLGERALTLLTRAELEHRAGEVAAAEATLEEAERHLAGLGSLPGSRRGRALEATRKLVLAPAATAADKAV